MALNLWFKVSSCIVMFTCLVATTEATNSKCINYAKYIHHHHKTQGYTSIDSPSGVWVSTRCEVLPGPGKSTRGIYTYRRFLFENGRWSGHIYHYTDSWCTKPAFTIKFDGVYSVFRVNSSVSYRISSPSDFKFRNIKFVSDKEDEIEKFLGYMINKCEDAVPDFKKDGKINLPSFVGKEIDINEYVLKKKHCRFYLALHPYSYKKMRLVDDLTRRKYTSLFFGDIPKVNVPKMQQYKPQSFQYELARVDRPWCNICKLGENNDKIPILPLPTAKNDFIGEWVSETCSAYDESTFRTVYYNFEDDKFSLYQFVFVDENCKRKKYSYQIGGSYNQFEMDQPIDGIVGIRVTITWMKITVYDKELLYLLEKSRNCGIAELWKEGVEQDVTSTNGCLSVFSVSLPYQESYVMRAAKMDNSPKLYISDYSSGLSFSSNLVGCDAVTKDIVVKHSTQAPTTIGMITETTKDPDDVNQEKFNKHLEETLRTEMNRQKDSSVANTLQTSLTCLILCLFSTAWALLRLS